MSGTTRKAFAAVRCTNGTEWIDLSSVKPLREMAEERAQLDNMELGMGYAAANPVTRVVPVVLQEQQSAGTQCCAEPGR